MCVKGEKTITIIVYYFSLRIKHVFRTHYVKGIASNLHPVDDSFALYLKMFILLFADITVILSSSIECLQHALNVYAEYCSR